MADEYLAMLQGMNPDEAQAMAAKLRGQDQFGKVFASSLTPNAQRLGQADSADAMNKVKTIGLARAKKAAQEEADRRDELHRDQAQENWDKRLEFDYEKMRRDSVFKQTTEDKIARAEAKEDRRYRQALSRDLTKAGIPEMNKGIDIVDQALVKYEGENLPGFGAGKFSPSDEARALRGKLSGIENVLLKARSGAAVTDQEYERFRKELLGEGWLASDADFRRSWADLKAKIVAAEEGILWGYPELQEAYYGGGSATGGGDAATPTEGDDESYF